MNLFQCPWIRELTVWISLRSDKLDKMPWAEVKKEMVEEKGLSEEVADKIGEWVVLKGGKDLLEKLQSDAALAANESMSQGMADMGLLFEYLECYKDTLNAVSFDLSLARGLDYYTGIIYEGKSCSQESRINYAIFEMLTVA